MSPNRLVVIGGSDAGISAGIGSLLFRWSTQDMETAFS